MSKETQNVDIVDVAVIGAGPTGLFAAFYAGMREISVKVIESMPQLGGQLSALYPEKYIYDVAGFPKIRAQKLVDQLVEQANLFDPIYCLDEKVESVQKNSDGIFEVRTQKEIHLAKAVLITAGVGAFQPRRLTLPNAEKFEEKNLFYFINDLEQFRDKEVLIAGGGDSAVDWALMLEPIARQVTLVHRRDRFRAHESSVNQMKSSQVRILTPYEIESLYGETSIEKVRIRDSKEGIEEELKVDAVIVSFGFISALGPIKDWGLNIEKNSIVVNSKMETNIPGIYAAGDITTYPGKVKLIAVGFGEAPTAINNAKLYIDPEARLQPGHSSNMNL